MCDMATFNANDVLSVMQMPQGRAGVQFLNWKITAKPLKKRVITSPEITAGAGLYGLCFDDQLIYVGSYLGNIKSGANFSGDVVSARWWTHIGAITARGNCLHIAPSSLNALRKKLGLDHEMVTGFLAASDLSLLHKDSGNLGPLRRLFFAALHHDVFLPHDADPVDVLSRFTFMYVRYDSMPKEMNTQSLKSRIEEAEKALIKKLAPICNTKHVPRGQQAIEIRSSDVESLLRIALAMPEATA